MKTLKIILRIPFGILGCIGMMIFIPFVGMVFAPGGLLWFLCGVSLLSPIIDWLFEDTEGKYFDMTWRERLIFFTIPIWAPIIYGYRIAVFGEFFSDKIGFQK